MKIAFTIPIKPKQLQRHRTVSKGGRTWEYDPSKIDKRDFLARCLSAKPSQPMEGPLSMKLIFCYKRPATHYTKKGLKPSAPVWKDTRPDKSNLVKLVEDALNGTFYKDDAQLVLGLDMKKWADEDSVHVEIEELT